MYDQAAGPNSNKRVYVSRVYHYFRARKNSRVYTAITTKRVVVFVLQKGTAGGAHTGAVALRHPILLVAFRTRPSALGFQKLRRNTR